MSHRRQDQDGGAAGSPASPAMAQAHSSSSASAAVSGVSSPTSAAGGSGSGSDSATTQSTALRILIPGSVVGVESAGFLTLRVPWSKASTTTLAKLKRQTLTSIARKRARQELGPAINPAGDSSGGGASARSGLDDPANYALARLTRPSGGASGEALASLLDERLVLEKVEDWKTLSLMLVRRGEDVRLLLPTSPAGSGAGHRPALSLAATPSLRSTSATSRGRSDAVISPLPSPYSGPMTGAPSPMMTSLSRTPSLVAASPFTSATPQQFLLSRAGSLAASAASTARSLSSWGDHSGGTLDESGAAPPPRLGPHPLDICICCYNGSYIRATLPAATALAAPSAVPVPAALDVGPICSLANWACFDGTRGNAMPAPSGSARKAAGFKFFQNVHTKQWLAWRPVVPVPSPSPSPAGVEQSMSQSQSWSVELVSTLTDRCRWTVLKGKVQQIALPLCATPAPSHAHGAGPRPRWILALASAPWPSSSPSSLSSPPTPTPTPTGRRSIQLVGPVPADSHGKIAAPPPTSQMKICFAVSQGVLGRVPPGPRPAGVQARALPRFFVLTGSSLSYWRFALSLLGPSASAAASASVPSSQQHGQSRYGSLDSGVLQSVEKATTASPPSWTLSLAHVRRATVLACNNSNSGVSSHIGMIRLEYDMPEASSGTLSAQCMDLEVPEPAPTPGATPASARAATSSCANLDQWLDVLERRGVAVEFEEMPALEARRCRQRTLWQCLGVDPAAAEAAATPARVAAPPLVPAAQGQDALAEAQEYDRDEEAWAADVGDDDAASQALQQPEEKEQLEGGSATPSSSKLLSAQRSVPASPSSKPHFSRPSSQPAVAPSPAGTVPHAAAAPSASAAAAAPRASPAPVPMPMSPLSPLSPAFAGRVLSPQGSPARSRSLHQAFASAAAVSESPQLQSQSQLVSASALSSAHSSASASMSASMSATEAAAEGACAVVGAPAPVTVAAPVAAAGPVASAPASAGAEGVPSVSSAHALPQASSQHSASPAAMVSAAASPARKGLRTEPPSAAAVAAEAAAAGAPLSPTKPAPTVASQVASPSPARGPDSAAVPAAAVVPASPQRHDQQQRSLTRQEDALGAGANAATANAAPAPEGPSPHAAPSAAFVAPASNVIFAPAAVSAAPIGAGLGGAVVVPATAAAAAAVTDEGVPTFAHPHQHQQQHQLGSGHNPPASAFPNAGAGAEASGAVAAQAMAGAGAGAQVGVEAEADAEAADAAGEDSDTAAETDADDENENQQSGAEGASQHDRQQQQQQQQQQRSLDADAAAARVAAVALRPSAAAAAAASLLSAQSPARPLHAHSFAPSLPPSLPATGRILAPALCEESWERGSAILAEVEAYMQVHMRSPSAAAAGQQSAGASAGAVGVAAASAAEEAARHTSVELHRKHNEMRARQSAIERAEEAARQRGGNVAAAGAMAALALRDALHRAASADQNEPASMPALPASLPSAPPSAPPSYRHELPQHALPDLPPLPALPALPSLPPTPMVQAYRSHAPPSLSLAAPSTVVSSDNAAGSAAGWSAGISISSSPSQSNPLASNFGSHGSYSHSAPHAPSPMAAAEAQARSHARSHSPSLAFSPVQSHGRARVALASPLPIDPASLATHRGPPATEGRLEETWQGAEGGGDGEEETEDFVWQHAQQLLSFPLRGEQHSPWVSSPFAAPLLVSSSAAGSAAPTARTPHIPPAMLDAALVPVPRPLSLGGLALGAGQNQNHGREKGKSRASKHSSSSSTSSPERGTLGRGRLRTSSGAGSAGGAVGGGRPGDRSTSSSASPSPSPSLSPSSAMSVGASTPHVPAGVMRDVMALLLPRNALAAAAAAREQHSASASSSSSSSSSCTSPTGIPRARRRSSSVPHGFHASKLDGVEADPLALFHAQAHAHAYGSASAATTSDSDADSTPLVTMRKLVGVGVGVGGGSGGGSGSMFGSASSPLMRPAALGLGLGLAVPHHSNSLMNARMPSPIPEALPGSDGGSRAPTPASATPHVLAEMFARQRRRSLDAAAAPPLPAAGAAPASPVQAGQSEPELQLLVTNRLGDEFRDVREEARNRLHTRAASAVAGSGSGFGAALDPAGHVGAETGAEQWQEEEEEEGEAEPLSLDEFTTAQPLDGAEDDQGEADSGGVRVVEVTLAVAALPDMFVAAAASGAVPSVVAGAQIPQQQQPQACVGPLSAESCWAMLESPLAPSSPDVRCLVHTSLRSGGGGGGPMYLACTREGQVAMMSDAQLAAAASQSVLSAFAPALQLWRLRSVRAPTHSLPSGSYTQLESVAFPGVFLAVGGGEGVGSELWRASRGNASALPLCTVTLPPRAAAGAGGSSSKGAADGSVAATAARTHFLLGHATHKGYVRERVESQAHRAALGAHIPDAAARAAAGASGWFKSLFTGPNGGAASSSAVTAATATGSAGAASAAKAAPASWPRRFLVLRGGDICCYASAEQAVAAPSSALALYALRSVARVSCRGARPLHAEMGEEAEQDSSAFFSLHLRGDCAVVALQCDSVADCVGWVQVLARRGVPVELLLPNLPIPAAALVPSAAISRTRAGTGTGSGQQSQFGSPSRSLRGAPLSPLASSQGRSALPSAAVEEPFAVGWQPPSQRQQQSSPESTWTPLSPASAAAMSFDFGKWGTGPRPGSATPTAMSPPPSLQLQQQLSPVHLQQQLPHLSLSPEQPHQQNELQLRLQEQQLLIQQQQQMLQQYQLQLQSPQHALSPTYSSPLVQTQSQQHAEAEFAPTRLRFAPAPSPDLGSRSASMASGAHLASASAPTFAPMSAVVENEWNMSSMPPLPPLPSLPPTPRVPDPVPVPVLMAPSPPFQAQVSMSPPQQQSEFALLSPSSSPSSSMRNGMTSPPARPSPPGVMLICLLADGGGYLHAPAAAAQLQSGASGVSLDVELSERTTWSCTDSSLLEGTAAPRAGAGNSKLLQDHRGMFLCVRGDGTLYFSGTAVKEAHWRLHKKRNCQLLESAHHSDRFLTADAATRRVHTVNAAAALQQMQQQSGAAVPTPRRDSIAALRWRVCHAVLQATLMQRLAGDGSWVRRFYSTGSNASSLDCWSSAEAAAAGAPVLHSWPYRSMMHVLVEPSDPAATGSVASANAARLDVLLSSGERVCLRAESAWQQQVWLHALTAKQVQVIAMPHSLQP